jgi:hypothetical protein
MPTDSAVEIFGYITRYPTLGTFTVNENGSFVYLGATDYFEAKVYADGTLLVSDLGYGVGVTHISMYVGTPVSTFAGGPILGPTDVSGGLASSQVGTPGRRIGPRLALLANGQMAVLF